MSPPLERRVSPEVTKLLSMAHDALALALAAMVAEGAFKPGSQVRFADDIVSAQIMLGHALRDLGLQPENTLTHGTVFR